MRGDGHPSHQLAAFLETVAPSSPGQASPPRGLVCPRVPSCLSFRSGTQESPRDPVMWAVKYQSSRRAVNRGAGPEPARQELLPPPRPQRGTALPAEASLHSSGTRFHLPCTSEASTHPDLRLAGPQCPQLEDGVETCLPRQACPVSLEPAPPSATERKHRAPVLSRQPLPPGTWQRTDY